MDGSTGEAQRRSRHGLGRVDVVCLVALGMACARALAGLESVVDLSMHDEAGYLSRGLQLATRGLPDPEWGPLYSLWYHLLGRLQPEPVALYYLSYRTLTVLTTVGTYVAARGLSAPPWQALAASALYLVSGAPHVLPRPSLLALAVVLAAVVLGARARSAAGFLFTLGLGLRVAAAARPESFVSFLVVSAGLATALVHRGWRERVWREPVWRSPSAWSTTLGVAGAYAVGVAVVLVLLGNPFGNSSNRRGYAFCQHFAVNWTAHHPELGLEPWGDCSLVLRAVFGRDVRGLAEAARATPSAFLFHVRENASRTLPAFGKLFLQGYAGGSPFVEGWTAERGVRWVLLVLAVLWPLALGVTRAAALVRSGAWVRTWRAGALLVAVALPTAASVVLIQPREHYLVMAGVSLLFLLGALASAAARAAPASPWRMPQRLVQALPPHALQGLSGVRPALGLAGVLAVATPPLVPESAPRAAFLRARGQQHLTTVRFLADLQARGALPGGEQGLDMLEADGGYPEYLGAPHRRVWPGHKRQPFVEFLRRHSVDAVVLDPLLAADRRFRDDPAFRAFAADPSAFGFTAQPIPGTDKVLALRVPGAVQSAAPAAACAAAQPCAPPSDARGEAGARVPGAH